MVNLFAFRATDPIVLLRVAEPIGPQNDKFISELSRNAAFVIVAWGANGACTYRAKDVLEILKGAGRKVYCLGKTKSGAPKHPLYLPRTAKPELYQSCARAIKSLDPSEPRQDVTMNG